jgi:hypothetical protein
MVANLQKISNYKIHHHEITIQLLKIGGIYKMKGNLIFIQKQKMGGVI